MYLSRHDTLLKWVLGSCAAAVCLLLVLIIAFLIMESLPALSEISFFRFFNDASWHPLEGQFSLSAMLWGSLWVTVGAILVAAPLGIVSAVFCHFYAPPSVAAIFRRIIELLAGIPSVVYGFWGLVVLVPFIAQYQPPGASLLAGILVLALMILPTITLLSDECFSRNNTDYPLNAHALGLSKWTTIRHIVLPLSKKGIGTGIILATSRALGETMAVLMVCGNIVQNPHSLFDPIRTLTANIALEIAYATDYHRSALFVTGLLLMLAVTLLQILTHKIDTQPSHGQ